MDKINTFTDAALLLEVKKNNQSALKVLYYRYYEALCRFASIRFNRIDHYEDMVQEVFLQFWIKRKQIYIKKSLKAYLYRMVNNFILNDMRKTKRLTDLDSMESNTHKLISHDCIEEKLDIQLAINSLPDNVKAVYILKSFEGLYNREIAETLEISIKTVEVRMAKAYMLLREFLN